jgi:hypothetical protein
VRRGNEAVMAVLKGVEPSGERKRWSPLGKKLTRTRKKLHALPSEKEDRRRVVHSPYQTIDHAIGNHKRLGPKIKGDIDCVALA